MELCDISSGVVDSVCSTRFEFKMSSAPKTEKAKAQSSAPSAAGCMSNADSNSKRMGMADQQLALGNIGDSWGEENENYVQDDDDDEDDAVEEVEKLPFRDPPIDCVRLRPSAFRNIPATVFIEYPPELGMTRKDESEIEELGTRKLGYRSAWERICIRNAFMRAGFVKSQKYWTAMWSKHQNDGQMKELNCLQKINHFPSSWCVGRKDRLVRTMQAMYRKHGSEFNFHPASYILPAEREALHRQIAIDQKGKTKSSISQQGGLWILKPVASSCGRGINVVTGTQVLAMPKSKKLLVQKYVHDPYLIDGKKFDLRIYVIVTGVDPLRVYVHKEGLTRISTNSYSLKNLSDRFAHLTNYSINKKSAAFKAAEYSGMDDNGDNDNSNTPEVGEGGAASCGAANESSGPNNGPGADFKDPETEGFKWSFSAFQRWLTRKEGAEVTKNTCQRIDDLLVKTMIAAESTITPQLHASANYRTNCFELFGCDVMLDSKLTPHLVEVNISPSLAGSSPLDKRIKGMVIADAMHTVGIYPHDPKVIKKYDQTNTAVHSKSTRWVKFIFVL